ncbi:GntR family transcriptional regulator [Microbacterium faecale]|uniref:GntR family transcriptional regulator n=1 Tax=Microbacterium faecale TaxID=1804630 RepID=A0A917DCU3_9MICO|nr:GntR family transcriptional regulator [Microbacterium faecale]GGD26760.1 GntR family transcriptional regulator [Microbacterium faecale]
MAADSGFMLSTASLTDALYDAVRRRIVEGDIAPGEKVTEARLAAEYNVARPTARAGLERLAATGLLTRSAHKTATVPTLNGADVVDIFVGRQAVESCAVSLLAGSNMAPRAALRAHADLEAAVERSDFSDQVTADMRFHRSLVADSGSTRLARMHELIMGEVELTMGQYLAHRTSPSETIVSEHDQILAAIATGDSAAAQAALLAHLERAKTRLLDRIESTTGPST